MKLLAFALSGTFALGVLADEPFSFCKDNKCGDCPVEVTSVGTGFPNCVVYNSDDVFANQGYPGSEGGGYRPYLDIVQPAPGCSVLVKSPASTTEAGCGFLVGAFSNAACAVLNIEKSFMVQFCCGIDDCRNAGAGKRIKRSAKFGDFTVIEDRAAGGMYSLKLRSPNGTEIQPIEVGLPPELRPTNEARSAVPASPLQRKSVCEENSWVPDAGHADYTRPADNTQIVYGSVASGPSDVTITHERSQSWTTTLGGSVGFEDILSLGISFEQSFSESITDSKSIVFHIPDGQTGRVGFTAFLRCSRGHGRCNGADVSGEVCTPYNIADDIAGEYAVIVGS